MQQTLNQSLVIKPSYERFHMYKNKNALSLKSRKYLIYLSVMTKKYLLYIYLFFTTYFLGCDFYGSPNDWGGRGSGSSGSISAPGLILSISSNCDLWNGSFVTIFNNSSGYVSDEILIQGIGNLYSESIFLGSAGTYQLQVKFFKSDGENLNKSFSVHVSETSMTKYEISCN